MSIRIRRFHNADLPRVLRLETACFRSDAWRAAEFRHYASVAPGLFFLAIAPGNRLAGYCIAQITRPGHGEIQSIAVRTSFQRRGIGHALLRRAINALRRGGAVHIGLMVRRDNHAAIHLYREFGFFRRRTVQSYYQDGSSAWRMTRPAHAPLPSGRRRMPEVPR